MGEAADVIEAIEKTIDTVPEVVLMDVRMPRMDGIEATRRLLAKAVNPPRVLALTTFDLDEYISAAVQAGASGFMLKEVSPDDLVHAVHVVARGEAMLAPSLTRRLLERFASRPLHRALPESLSSLSERELRRRIFEPFFTPNR